MSDPPLPFGWIGSIGAIDRAVREAPDPAVFLEVGSWEGASAIWVAKAARDLGKTVKLHCVDWWQGTQGGEEHSYAGRFHSLEQEGHTPYTKFLANVAAWGFEECIIPHKMKSLEAAPLFEDQSLDYLLIDADHHEEMALADIEAWAPKLKVGGVLMIDDWPETGPSRAIKRGLTDRDYPHVCEDRFAVWWNWPGWPKAEISA